LQVGRPVDIGCAHITRAGHARLGVRHGTGVSQVQFDAEHQFLPLIAGFHFLGSELGFGGDKADLRRQRLVGQGVEQNARVAADGEPAGDGGWQVEEIYSNFLMILHYFMYPYQASYIPVHTVLIRMTKKLSYSQTEKLGSLDLKVG